MEKQLLNSKQLNIVLGIVVIVLLAFIAYLLVKLGRSNNAARAPKSNTITSSPKNTTNNNQSNVAEKPTDPTPQSVINQRVANWKQYQSNKYGFKIGYPKEWKLINSSDSALTVATTEECKDDNQSVEKMIEQYKQCNRFTVWAGDTARANYSGDPDGYFRVMGEKFIYNSPTQATLNGQVVYIPKVEISGQVARDGVLYKFSLNFHQGNINQALYLFDDFVSMFKFVKK